MRPPGLGGGADAGTARYLLWTFADERRALERALASMRRLASEQIADAVRTLGEEGPRPGRAALRERAIDALRARIEDRCFAILARRPRTTRRERRILATAIRIATALERIGDLGTLMIDRFVELSHSGRGVDAAAILQRMAANAVDMMTRGVAAFTAEDVELAATVRSLAPLVDECGARLVRDVLRTFGGGDPALSGPAMGLVVIGGYLEQIAAHAGGIADRVVLLMEEAPRRDRRRAPVPSSRAMRRDIPRLPLPAGRPRGSADS